MKGGGLTSSTGGQCPTVDFSAAVALVHHVLLSLFSNRHRGAFKQFDEAD
jgi:hypothetical protein